MIFYRYVQNDPVNAVDPWGLETVGASLYIGAGGEISKTTTTCCEGGTKYRVTYWTIGGGVGGNAGVSGLWGLIKSLAKGSAATSTNSNVLMLSEQGWTQGENNPCPKTGTYMKKKLSAGIGDINAKIGFTNNSIGFASRLVPSFGVRAAIAGDIVTNKEAIGKCCNN